VVDRILAITGAAGRIGSAVRPLLRPHYRLHLIDIQPIAGLDAERETSAQADVTDLDAVDEALDGANCVIHLAGEPRTGATWSEVRDRNIEGTFNVFEAARRAGAEKVIFASTNHVRGFDYLDGHAAIDDAGTFRPDSLYGVSKAFGESLARYYCDAFGMHILCIRIGWFTPDPPNIPGLNPLWISARDLAQLFRLALESPRQFGIYNGTSANRGSPWDIQRTRDDLGFAPEDDVANFVVAREGAVPPYVDPQAGVLRTRELR
jgi:nucleoside-diphosphate-sugar epimerase